MSESKSSNVNSRRGEGETHEYKLGGRLLKFVRELKQHIKWYKFWNKKTELSLTVTV